MSFEEDAERFKQRLLAAVVDALEEYGGMVEDQIAAQLNVAYPPASVPGEFPHRRTGALRAGLSHDQPVVEGTLVLEQIISQREPQKGETTNVPGILNSANALNRPYMTDTYRQLVERFPQEIRAMIAERMNK